MAGWKIGKGLEREGFVRELIVDNFAGGGGASLGIEMAGFQVDIAVNHDEEAIAMHIANHPWTEHHCESVWKVDPLVVTKGRPVGLAWFSPDCKHHSKAKGGKPVNKKIRGLAWVAVRWARAVHPKVIVLENVEEFQDWGPLLPNKKPDLKRRGETFHAFVSALQKLGYEVEWRELRACDYGAPTIRKRLFLVARCDGRPIAWPEPTHGDPKTLGLGTLDRLFKTGLKPWRTAAECIDFDARCPSIFERKIPLAKATLRRVARGIKKFVLEAEKPFIVSGPNVVPHIVTVAHGEESPGGVKRWGKGIQDVTAPLPTITGKGSNALVSAHVIKYYGTNIGLPANSPLHTVTTKDRMGVVETTLAPIVVPIDHRGSGDGVARSADDPLSTVTAENRHAVAGVFLAKHYGGVTGTPLDQPLGTVTSIDHHSLVCAHIKRDFKSSIGHPADSPLGTVTAGGGGKADIVTTYMVKLKGDNIGQAAEKPLATVTAGGLHHGEVRTTLSRGEASNDDMKREKIREFALEYLGVERMTLTIGGEDWEVVDIGLRMLSPRELARAQGFPDSYTLDPVVIGKGKKKRGPLSGTAQVRMIGNSVCPPLAEVIVRANYSRIQTEREVTA